MMATSAAAQASIDELMIHSFLTLDGNLCCCLGYRPILTAFGEFAEGGKQCGSSKMMTHPAEMLQYAESPAPLHFVDEETGEEYYKPCTMAQMSSAHSAATASKKAVRFVRATTGMLYIVCAVRGGRARRLCAL